MSTLGYHGDVYCTPSAYLNDQPLTMDARRRSGAASARSMMKALVDAANTPAPSHERPPEAPPPASSPAAEA